MAKLLQNGEFWLTGVIDGDDDGGENYDIISERGVLADRDHGW